MVWGLSVNQPDYTTPNRKSPNNFSNLNDKNLFNNDFPWSKSFDLHIQVGHTAARSHIATKRVNQIEHTLRHLGQPKILHGDPYAVQDLLRAKSANGG